MSICKILKVLIVDDHLTSRMITVEGCRAMGISHIMVAKDGREAYTKLLKDPVRAKIFSVRLGHTVISRKHPERNIAFWIGGMRQRLDLESSGEIALNEALPSSFWDRKDLFVSDYNEWYGSLSPGDEYYRAATLVLNPIVENIDEKDGSGMVRYSINKAPKQEWNFLIGAQYQYSKRWMFRTEWGVLGNRYSALLSLNYRFKI